MKNLRTKNINLTENSLNNEGRQSNIRRLMGNAFNFALLGLLLLATANFNVRGQSAESFNPNVVYTLGSTSLATVQSIVRQPDGKILIGGIFTSVGGQPVNKIARLNPDGTRDATFNSPFAANGTEYVTSIALLPDGKILIGGTFNWDAPAPNNITGVKRLNSDGSVDTSFVRVPVATVKAIFVLSDGGILIGSDFNNFGAPTNRPFITKLFSNGDLELSFNPRGDLLTSNGGDVRHIIQQPDGKIIIGGAFRFFSPSGEIDLNTIARINTNGTFDTSFNPVFSPSGGINAMAQQPDGKIIIGGGGFFTINNIPRRTIARLSADGAVDTSFNANNAEGTTNIAVEDIALQADGKILVGGFFTNIGGQPRNALARLNSNGSADGFVSNNGGNNAGPVSIVVQPDGKILVSGNFTIMGGEPRNNIARLYSSELGEGTQPILFTSNRDGNNEIYKMNVDGSNQQRLTNSPEGESNGYWSPNGQKILYNKSINSTTLQIWVMNADGTNQTLISETTGLNNLYKWSPNNQKIAFVRRETGGTDQIWTMNADGSNKSRLTNTTTNDHYPDWSPGGSKIAFGRCNASFLCDIFTMNADGSNQVNITPNSAEDDDDLPQWSKNGSKIIFGFADIDASGQNVITSNIFIMNADGTNRQSLTNATTTSSFAYRPGSSKSSISPNGNRIAASLLNRVPTTSTEFQNSLEVSSVGIDGSNLVNLTNNSVRDDFGAWSPDSAKIAFQSRRDSPADEIYTMNADGSGVNRLTFNTANEVVSDWFTPIAPRRTPFDFDGDGKADISVFRPENGTWYIQQSQAGFTGLAFGLATDKLAPADYDGDGKTDVAVVRNGTWYLQRSQTGFTGITFGDGNDIPVPADYDGDGKAEIAVFRPSNGYWYILNLVNNQFTATLFGLNGDKPVPADYDGDSKADIAVNRNGNWYLNRSQLGFTGVLFGDSNDKLTPADYDGDGKADIAVFRPSNGTWYLLQSEAGFTGLAFGFGTDIPAAADFDGDGKADIAVVRNGNWYLNRTASGFTGIQFGTASDKPIPNSFIR